MATSTTKSQRIAIWIIAAMMVVGSVGFYFLIILQNNQMAEDRARLQEQLQQATAEPQSLPGQTATPFEAETVDALVKEDLKQGEGKTVQKGDTLTVNYMGWLPSGEIFDSTNRSGTPQPVQLSLDGVIKGWQQGIPGMKEGGVRKLIIPAELAYGEQGNSSIPPSTPIAFIVEVVKIESN